MLWSKGPIRNAYSNKGTEYLATEQEIVEQIMEATDVLWIRNGSLGHLRKTDLDIAAIHFDKLKNPVTLITTDGDRFVPSSYGSKTVDAILNHPKITKWLTQNYDRTVVQDKIGYMPIGFDFHTPRWLIANSVDAKINYMLTCRQNYPIPKVKDKIFLDAHLTPSSLERDALRATIRNNSAVICLKSQVSFSDITKIYNMYQFVLSPHGRGFDCHRTWELFLAGCIVIVKSSPLDEMYKAHKLPVVILKNWAELNENLDQKLKQWYNDYNELLRLDHILPRLQFLYWISS
jgi:hypothetical protein